MRTSSIHYFTLDLRDDPEAIQRYEAYHQNVWPEIIESIKKSGIIHMEIYRAANRLFMVMQVDDTFSFEAKAIADQNNPRVQEWELLMDQFQQRLPFAKTGEKWVRMDRIFFL